MKPHRMSRQESKEQTRERLLEAAHAVFMQCGFAEATIEDITAEAGYTRGAFYSNFEGKPEVLLELLARTHRSMVGGGEQIAALEGDPGQIFTALVNYYSKLFHQKDTFMLWSEARVLALRDQEFRSRFNAMVDQDQRNLVELIRKVSDRLGLKLSLSPEVIALGLASLLDGLRSCPMTEVNENGGAVAEQVLGGFMTAVLRSA